MRYAAPIPEIPAPMISTSQYSASVAVKPKPLWSAGYHDRVHPLSASTIAATAHWCTILVSVIFFGGCLVHHLVCRLSWMDCRCTRGGCWFIALLARRI